MDGMCIVQKLNMKNITFADVTNAVLKSLLREGDKSQKIDAVFDVYLDTSINDAERQKHGASTGMTFKRFLFCSSYT